MRYLRGISTDHSQRPRRLWKEQRPPFWGIATPDAISSHSVSREFGIEMYIPFHSASKRNLLDSNITNRLVGGCEHGANEHGVVIGNEAVWTLVPEELDGKGNIKKLLLGMDLVRLGLERGRTSRAALEVITCLLEEHGQGGPCAEDDPSFTYHNSFLIADAKEAFVLETAGRHWVAQKWTSGGRNISNGLTIRTNFDLCSKGIREYATKAGLWDGSDDFDFAAIFSEGGASLVDSNDGRQGRGRDLLDQHEGSQTFDKNTMISILRDHKGGICMHGSDFETTVSMVNELFRDSSADKHWTTGPHPCTCTFSLQTI